MRTSSAFPFSFSREEDLPGTRSMSPNEASRTRRSLPREIAASMYPSGVTQTGQPGPESIVTAPDRSGRMPLRAMATVCVPHTSIRRTGAFPASPRIRSTSAFAVAGSRKSSMYFSRIRDLPEQRERLFRLHLREFPDGEAGVDDHPFPDDDVVDEHHGDLPPHPSQLHHGGGLVPLQDLRGNPEAHAPTPLRPAWPRNTPARGRFPRRSPGPAGGSAA